MDPLGADSYSDGDTERRGAGRGRGRGPWTSPSNEVSVLRRPHAISGVQTAASTDTKDTEQSKSDKPDQFTNNIIQNSTLSVHAAEFFPKSYSRKQPLKRSVQDRIQIAREIPLQAYQMQQVQNPVSNYDTSQHYQQIDQVQQCDNFLQQQQAKQPSNIQNSRLFDEDLGYMHMYEMLHTDQENHFFALVNMKEKLMSVIHSLILNPGRFTSIVPPLINDISFYLKTPCDLQEIIKVIIQQSITEGNFRYSGARLCASLDSAISPTQQKLFRETLYTLCKSEMENHTSNWKEKDDHTEEEQKKCHGLILFLAELVIQMEHTTTFGLGDLLIQLIINILKKPAPNSVKNICQALKLAGHTLEKGKGGSRKEMENMMRALTELVTTGRVDTHIGRMVHSVHQLRNGNWGHTPTVDSSVESTENTDQNEVLDEPVFYGPDGKVLTAEENKFLADVADCTTNFENYVISDDDFEDHVTWTSAEDDEIDAAYEEFLKHIPNKIKNQNKE
ncbi:polyadenylate-binding protein-interacting protein 1 isoform X2 [Nomia melanderi]|nr:polyadenylate-binding protein-interacting protein 1 isoform X2 [Nomia melanderi]XP_031846437.1 polyadenylate-binding protein-interacting protein 1 isoform X2 [Nomia melanderi]XP_031846439.1 polyadenylate-binding protein-interacting protein 1 isoform X2 [Nomia melanderi]XP_031846440.1 polyadenylate-binding protein-interacting protein 1 isoform X2 [Nomia melanderi]XP_031846441.1 polyadenylate-binding protein-interacting protein 1 isoform X2 [Nomia melanderi]